MKLILFTYSGTCKASFLDRSQLSLRNVIAIMLFLYHKDHEKSNPFVFSMPLFLVGNQGRGLLCFGKEQTGKRRALICNNFNHWLAFLRV